MDNYNILIVLTLELATVMFWLTLTVLINVIFSERALKTQHQTTGRQSEQPAGEEAGIFPQE